MADTSQDGSVLRKMLSAGKKRPVAFAFSSGKKGDCLLIDSRKDAEQLARAAKTETGNPKVGFGELTVSGSAINLDIASDLPKLAKQIKDHLKSLGIRMDVSAGAEVPAPQEDAPKEQPGSDAREAPAASSALANARKAWSQARSSAANDIKTLVDAIASTTKGMDGLENLPQQASKLATRIAPLDDRLGKLLQAMDSAPDQPTRDKLKRAAKLRLGEHVKLMNSDFFKSVDDNGFAKTAIRTTVLASLKTVNEALDA